MFIFLISYLVRLENPKETLNKIVFFFTEPESVVQVLTEGSIGLNKIIK